MCALRSLLIVRCSPRQYLRQVGGGVLRYKSSVTARKEEIKRGIFNKQMQYAAKNKNGPGQCLHKDQKMNF